MFKSPWLLAAGRVVPPVVLRPLLVLVQGRPLLLDARQQLPHHDQRGLAAGVDLLLFKFQGVGSLLLLGLEFLAGRPMGGDLLGQQRVAQLHGRLALGDHLFQLRQLLPPPPDGLLGLSQLIHPSAFPLLPLQLATPGRPAPTPVRSPQPGRAASLVDLRLAGIEHGLAAIQLVLPVAQLRGQLLQLHDQLLRRGGRLAHLRRRVAQGVRPVDVQFRPGAVDAPACGSAAGGMGSEVAGEASSWGSDADMGSPRSGYSP